MMAMTESSSRQSISTFRIERDSSWDYFQLVAAADVVGIANYRGDRALIDVSNSQGMTPLLVACHEGMTSVVEALIRAGADPLRANTEGSMPLMFAKDYGVRSGDYSVCRVLLDAGSDPLVSDRFGRTVLDYVRLKDERSALNFFGAASDA
jgi:ankyrin repeat protein